MKLPKSIKSFVRAAGLGRPAGSPPPGGVLFSDRATLGTKCVFDVGANKGQFGRTLRRFGYTGTIVSFEPLSTAHARLLEAARSDPLWRVHDRCAIGRTAGETSINISANSVSSSILPTTPELEQAESRTGYVGIEHVAVVPLSDVFEQYASPKGGNYLKIDTQGFEAEVLAGAEPVLDRIDAVQLELSTIPLYAGGPTYEHFLAYFAERDFALWDLRRGFTDPDNQRMLQFDALFVRSGQFGDPA